MLKLVEWMSVTLKKIMMIVVKPRALEDITSLHSVAQRLICYGTTQITKMFQKSWTLINGKF